MTYWIGTMEYFERAGSQVYLTVKKLVTKRRRNKMERRCPTYYEWFVLFMLGGLLSYMAYYAFVLNVSSRTLIMLTALGLIVSLYYAKIAWQYMTLSGSDD